MPTQSTARGAERRIPRITKDYFAPSHLPRWPESLTVSSMTKKTKETLTIVAVLAVGGFFITRGLLRQNTAALGDECSSGSDECKGGLQCMSMNDKSYCSKMCMQASECGNGTTCRPIKVTMKNASGFHDINGSYCVR